MLAYKGFDRNLQCRGYQFEPGPITLMNDGSLIMQAQTGGSNGIYKLDVANRKLVPLVSGRRVIAFTGLAGSGKSTVGRQLARRLGLPFFDSDHVIEERLGCTIRDYFAREGEVAARLHVRRVRPDHEHPVGTAQGDRVRELHEHAACVR